MDTEANLTLYFNYKSCLDSSPWCNKLISCHSKPRIHRIILTLFRWVFIIVIKYYGFSCHFFAMAGSVSSAIFFARILNLLRNFPCWRILRLWYTKDTSMVAWEDTYPFWAVERRVSQESSASPAQPSLARDTTYGQLNSSIHNRWISQS